MLDEHEATSLFAVESGSRAWGFESATSDYDVRFVYWMPQDWYLSVESKRDTIEEIGDDDLDFAGWDLRKALGLAHKSNPSLHDWLATKDFYHRHDPLFEEFRELCLDYFDPHAGYLHYRSMAKRNFEAYFDAKDIPIKKYFYVIRPLLCAKSVAENLRPAPCLFRDLLDSYYQRGEVREEVDRLLELKRLGRETEQTTVNPVVHSEIGRLLADTTRMPAKRKPMGAEALNDFFIRVVSP